MTLMRAARRKTPFGLKTAVVLLSLLAILATLQYRWLGQVSEAERQRMRTGLQSAVSRFADDFDREITAAFLGFASDSGIPFSDRRADHVERFRFWGEEAPHPEMISNLFLVGRDPGGELKLEKLDPDSGRFEPSRWPDGWDELHRFLKRIPRTPGSPPPGLPFRSLVFSSPEDLVLIIPHGIPPMGNMRPLRWPVEEALDANVLLQLDLAFITQQLLPELTDRYFGSGNDYHVVVADRGQPRRVIFSSSEAGLDRFTAGDAVADLYFLRPLHMRQDIWLPDTTRPGGPSSDGSRLPRRRLLGRFLSNPPDDGGYWQLIVKHRAGSLESAVARARFRNAAISFGILILLAVSVVLLVVSTQRAQELARQKMEFVAGISHELRTPLSVIRSAGQNLADATIKDSEQVARYGTLIEHEGRRLSDLVDQVMQFAGAQSNEKAYKMEPVPAGKIIEDALADCRSAIEENGIQIEKHIPESPLMIRADRSALRRAVLNLLDNAIKYGGPKGWIGVSARLEESSPAPEVTIGIEDRGPGISKSDLPHLFEPFYRGAGSAQVRGSGLGLSLVQQIVAAHGGRVRVASLPHRGSRFTIHLPGVSRPVGEESQKGKHEAGTQRSI